MTTDMQNGWAHEVGPHRVELIDIGEGINGDFDPTNPDDEPVLCLDHFTRDDDGKWNLIDADFKRTTLPVTAPAETRALALSNAMDIILHPERTIDDTSSRRSARRSSGPAYGM
jgi:hypothetical protein